MNPEEWRSVPGVEGWEVSATGSVRRNETIARQYQQNGYLHVFAGGKTRAVHRLVLLAFIGPCPDGHEGCHGNGIRTDNRVENLRWDTRSANNRDRYAHGRGYVKQGRVSASAIKKRKKRLAYLAALAESVKKSDEIAQGSVKISDVSIENSI